MSHAKLTAAKVTEIRGRYAAGGVSYETLAQEFGVCLATIGNAVCGRLWKDVPGPLRTRTRTGPARGEEMPTARLTAAKVTEIRGRYAAGEATLTELAERFGVSKATIFNVVRGRGWKDAPGPILTPDRTGPACGEEHPRARLTDAKATEIRRLRAAGGVTLTELARQFGVTSGTVARVVKGLGYKHAARSAAGLVVDPGHPATDPPPADRKSCAIERGPGGSFKVRGKVKTLRRKAQRNLIHCLIDGGETGPDTFTLRKACGDYLNVFRGIRTDPDWASAILPPDRNGRKSTHWRAVHD